jgi:hypothetical protein
MSMMMRTLGLIVAAVFVAAGLAVAATLLPLFIGLGVTAAFAVLCLRQEKREMETASFALNPIRLAIGVAGGTVVVIYAAIGMTTVLGGAATALTGATALALVGYRQLIRSRNTERATGSRPGPAEALFPDVHVADVGAPDIAARDAGARVLMPTDPENLSTDELCRAWRVSYLLLQNARVAAELERASLLRRRYLEELAHRDPAGFRRWLDDGARAASDPARYVRRRPGPARRDEDQAA